jgi:hypothetical protein
MNSVAAVPRLHGHLLAHTLACPTHHCSLDDGPLGGVHDPFFLKRAAQKENCPREDSARAISRSTAFYVFTEPGCTSPLAPLS